MIRPKVELSSSMIILRSVELLKYICGHDEKWFGLFRVIVMDHHIGKYPMLAFRIFLFREEVRCVVVEKICNGKNNAVHFR